MDEDDALVRELQARRSADERTAAATEASQAIDAENERRQYIADVEALIPQAVAVLREKARQHAKLIKVDGRQGWPRVLKGKKSKEIAGWPVGSFTYHDYHGTGGNVRSIYLLTDGRWVGGSHTDSLWPCRARLPRCWTPCAATPDAPARSSSARSRAASLKICASSPAATCPASEHPPHTLMPLIAQP